MEKRLLIIDDNKEVTAIVSHVLSYLFDAIDIANSVGKAKKYLVNRNYTIVFLDIDLDKRNGAEILQFLIDNPENANNEASFVILSGIITPQFVDRYQNRFAGILMKPFEHEDLVLMVDNIFTKLEGKKAIGLDDEEAGEFPEEFAHEFTEVKYDFPFPIIQLPLRVHKILGQVKKSVKLNQLLRGMKIDRSDNNYFLTHIGILINIASAICVQIEWDSDKTLEKFVYAAYFHDMVLANRLDLIKVNSQYDLDKLKESCSTDEYYLVFEHANIAANIVKNVPGIPADVEGIIRQHHEHPNGAGFPAKCSEQKIMPLSVVFIVAHDFTDYIISNPKWDPNNLRGSVEDYLAGASRRYQGIHFTKVFRALYKFK